MTFLNLEALEHAPLAQEPFRFVVVPDFIHSGTFERIAADFPDISGPGSFPLDSLKVQGAFEALIGELYGPHFQQAIERKFEIDLSGRPKLITVRGQARQKDGAVHTDTSTKLISVLLYMNEDWAEEGGRLRLLGSPNLDDSLAEVAPVKGALVAFQRSDASWHGHRPFAGPRRVIQMNWMANRRIAMRERTRHLMTAGLKTFSHLFAG